MSAEELSRLADLHAKGALTDDEYQRAKARVLGGGGVGSASLSGYRRSVSDRWFGGVCGGLARSTGVDAWVWRLSFFFVAFCVGFGALLYLLLWVFAPQE
ncbi:PspC domain-containing protein [Roseateles sp. BYS180W]|uniref:PspC domain-containing protein n=1 Tax=Roseateles rivi TaxID=3299028 RepID=A0ABW7FWV3_9BURK